ncbi:hypothetical protein GCM10023212_35320 [Luteolibacter yonseiensis]
MRWFTCTPVEFGGGPDFFARDSGLMCRGLQSVGCDARAVMPGTRRPEDEADLIRTEFPNLESPAWWRSHELDGVVLYAWGSPRFRKVAAAIRQAGVYLVLNQDNGGLISPLAGLRGWLHEQWILSGVRYQPVGAFTFLKRVLKGITVGMLVTDPGRAAHLKQGDVIACVSPEAARHYKRLCRIYGGPALARRVRVIPHPVEPLFHYDGSPRKVRQIVCVGRWPDRLQKRPELMMAVFDHLLAEDSLVNVQIIGFPTPRLMAWLTGLPPGMRSRVRLRGPLDRSELSAVLRESMVFYSPSAFESFGIAAGEALCSGCSVVSGRSPSMSSFGWFVSEASGTQADTDDVRGHAAALMTELGHWDSGGRDTVGISKTWATALHAGNVAAKVLELPDTVP